MRILLREGKKFAKAVFWACGSVSLLGAAYAANDDAYLIVAESGPVSLDVLSNDASGDSRILQVAASNGAHVVGSVVNHGDYLEYRPATEFAGLDVFEYTAVSSTGTKSSAKVRVRVKGSATRWRIMPLGSSIVEGELPYDSHRREFYLQLVGAGFDVDFVGSSTGVVGGPAPSGDFDQDHEGHWGWRVDQFLESDRITTWAQASMPDVVFVHVGTNDLASGQGVASTILETDGIVQALRAVNPNMIIALAQLIPSTRMSDAVHTDYNIALANYVATVTTAESPVIAVDHATDFDVAVDTYDGTHPSASGQTKMADQWYEAIAPLINEEPELLSAPTNISINAGESISIDLMNHFADPEGQNLVFSATGLPPGVSLDAASGSVSGSIMTAGNWAPQLTATDIFNDSTSVSVSIVATNPVPPPPGEESSGGGGGSPGPILLILLLGLACRQRMP